MHKVAILTDTNSGIMEDNDEKGLFVIPMPININGNEYFEGLNISNDEFYQQQTSGADIKTSMPSLFTLEEIWNKILANYETIVYLPMSSALSSACEKATILSQEKFLDKVFVADIKRISCSLKIATENALTLAKQGLSAKEILEHLDSTKEDDTIYISIPTLTYLKKGGRLTPAASIVGTMLSIKPVLQIQRGKLDSFAKCFAFNACKIKMKNALKKDIETRLANKDLKFFVAHTRNLEQAQQFAKELEQDLNITIDIIDELPLSIATHIGPGSLACGCSVILN